MATFDQELTGRYAAAGGDRPDPDAAVTLLRMDAELGWLLE